MMAFLIVEAYRRYFQDLAYSLHRRQEVFIADERQNNEEIHRSKYVDQKEAM